MLIVQSALVLSEMSHLLSLCYATLTFTYILYLHGYPDSSSLTRSFLAGILILQPVFALGCSYSQSRETCTSWRRFCSLVGWVIAGRLHPLPVPPLTGEGAPGRAGKAAVLLPQPALPAAAGGLRGDLGRCESLTDACRWWLDSWLRQFIWINKFTQPSPRWFKWQPRSQLEGCPTKPRKLQSGFPSLQWLNHPSQCKSHSPWPHAGLSPGCFQRQPSFHLSFHHSALPFLVSRVCSQVLTTSLLPVSSAAASHMLPPLFSGYTLSLEHFSPALLLLFPTKHDFTPEFQTALQTFTGLQFFGVMSCRKHALPPGTSSPFLSHGEDGN